MSTWNKSSYEKVKSDLSLYQSEHFEEKSKLVEGHLTLSQVRFLQELFAQGSNP